MIDIRDLIEELQRHPDYICADIFTLHDVIEYIQDEINDELMDDFNSEINRQRALDYELNIDDMSVNDIEAIKDYMENMLEQIWKHVDGIYPSYNNLPDLRKKIDRQIILEKILNKK